MRLGLQSFLLSQWSCEQATQEHVEHYGASFIYSIRLCFVLMLHFHPLFYKNKSSTPSGSLVVRGTGWTVKDPWNVSEGWAALVVASCHTCTSRPHTGVILLNEDNPLNQACIVSILTMGVVSPILFPYHCDLLSACSADKHQRHRGGGLWIIAEKKIKLNHTCCVSIWNVNVTVRSCLW